MQILEGGGRNRGGGVAREGKGGGGGRGQILKVTGCPSSQEQAAKRFGW